eukprot:9172601-Alexandrium_andersonii.AAC.1
MPRPPTSGKPTMAPWGNPERSGPTVEVELQVGRCRLAYSGAVGRPSGQSDSAHVAVSAYLWFVAVENEK